MNIRKIIREEVEKIIQESKDVEWEFQLRDIGGPVFYKRKKGVDNWQFISAEEFAENCHSGKLVKWEEK